MNTNCRDLTTLHSTCIIFLHSFWILQLWWKIRLLKNFHFPHGSKQQGHEPSYAERSVVSSGWTHKPFCSICVVQNLHPVVLKSLIPESWCIFSFQWGCEWEEQRREQEAPTHNAQASIWPQPYHSITTCCWNKTSYTHTCTFFFHAHTQTQACVLTDTNLHSFFTSKHIIQLILATHKLHCVQPAATTEQYNTLANS